MRKIRKIVNSLEFFRGAAERGCDIAFFSRNDTGFARECGVLLALRAAVERGQRAFVPDNFQRFARTLCGPETVRDHCDAAFDFNHVLHAGNRFHFVRLEILQLPAKHRRTRDEM